MDRTTEHSVTNEETSAKASKQKVNVWICIATFIIYVFQSAPYGFFESLYPVLYGLADFDEEDLSFFRFSGVPWCLKVIIGTLFQRYWNPPCWFVFVLHILIGAFLIPLTWIPITKVNVSTAFFFIINSITVIHDVVYDGQMIVLFDNNAVVLEMIQLGAYLVFDVLLSFVGISFYTPYIFLIVGCLSILTSGLLFVYKWEDLPTHDYKGIWKDIKETVWPAITIFFYFFITTFGDSMLSYFGSDIQPNEDRIGIIFGCYMIGAFVGMLIGQYFFLKVTYHWAVVIALFFEAAAVLFFMFLTEKSKYGVQITMFLLGGFVTAATDAILQTLCIDASSTGSVPTFTYSWLQSLMMAGSTIGGCVFPLCKKNLTWIEFWGANIGICGGLAVIFALLYILIPSAYNDRTLKIKPTIKSLCGNKELQSEKENSSMNKEEESSYNNDESAADKV